MKRLYLTAIMMLCAMVSYAQFSMSKITPHEARSKQLSDSVKWAKYQNEYFSPGRYRAERRALIKQRNTLEYKIYLQGSTEQYNDSWKQGGNNNITGKITVFCYHTFTKNRFSLNTKLDANYGLTRIDSLWSKTSDAFSLYVAPSWKAQKNWSYGGSAKLRSQFNKGYDKPRDLVNRKVISKFMSPGYLDLNIGMTYTSPNKRWPFKVDISPASGSGTIVLDDDPTLRAKYGMPFIEVPDPENEGKFIKQYDKNVKFQGGSSLQVSYDKSFGKKKFMRYRSTLYSFYGWMTDLSTHYKEGQKHLVPTARWENWLDFNASKYLTTTIYWHFFYDRSQIDKLQIKYSLSFGLTYYFKNK